MTIWAEIENSFKKFRVEKNKIDYDDILQECKKYRNASFEEQVIFFKSVQTKLDKMYDFLLGITIVVVKESLEKLTDSFIERQKEDAKKEKFIMLKARLTRYHNFCLYKKDSMEEFRVYIENTLKYETHKLSSKEKANRFQIQIDWINAYISYLKELDIEYTNLFLIYRLNIKEFYQL